MPVPGAATDNNGESSIYRQLLGPEFTQLPANLQAFYGRLPKVSVHGKVDVQHGKNLLTRLLLRVFRLPPAGTGMALSLDIQRSPQGETWSRSFGRHQMTTSQQKTKQGIVEKIGPIRLTFTLVADPSSLTFHQRAVRILGLPIPAIIGVQTSATTSEAPGGFFLKVSSKSRMLGPLLTYSGFMQIGAT